MKDTRIFEMMQDLNAQGFTLAQALEILRATAKAEKDARKAWEVASFNILHDDSMDNAAKVAAMLEMLETDALTRKAAANDYGRIGDLIEVNVCAFLRGNAMQAKHAHVKAAGRKDMQYKGFTLEIGSNGKTFATRDASRQEAPFGDGWTIDDVLSEKVDFFVYGVRAAQIVEEAAYGEKMYVFTRDQLADFFQNSGLHGLTTNIHTTKSGYALTVQYNESYAKRFDKWVQEYSIPTLADFKARMDG
jgi:hypothetical protein